MDSNSLRRPTPHASRNKADWTRTSLQALLLLVLFFLFLLGVNGMGEGFELLGGGLLESFFAATRNPFIGLMIGILATSLVQSSSVTTSMIVGLVAAPENPLPVANAVPMVMGANFGTTVTNTIVALAHVHRKPEFKRAFAVSTCDDFFNLLAASILLPFELATGYLQRTAEVLSTTLAGVGGVTYRSPLQDVLETALAPVRRGISWIADSQQAEGLILAGVSAGFIFAALSLLVRTLRTTLAAQVETLLSGSLRNSMLLGMLGGMAVTVMVQSSSITTSTLVPLAGAGLLSLQSAFPIVLGANLGTTVTALMAALAATGPHGPAGIAIALVHLLFNLSGILLIYPLRRIREIPLACSHWLAGIAVVSPSWAIFYVVILFYGLPAAFALGTSVL